jgi:RNA polymerase sigma-32 factor
VSAAEVTEMERRLSSRDVSYDPAPDADDEEESYAPSAYLPAPDADPAVAVERAEWDDDVTGKVAHAMAQLDARSQAVLRARWMTDQKATLHDLADEFGVSAERIRQIEANAIKKLRKLVVADEA